LRNDIDKAYANIDVLLKQRSDEIPNLVKTVEGYMIHEKVTLNSLTKARSSLLESESASRKAALDDFISSSLKTIFAVVEKYPDLKAGENFLQLQKRITGLENEIADRRELYNDSVMIYNTRIKSIPDLIIAKMLLFKGISLFEATEDDKKYVIVTFKNQ
jgi:LemA protein